GQRQHQVVGGLIAITGADIQLAFRHGKVDALRSKLGKRFQSQATECQLAFRHQWIETEVSIPEEMATLGAGNLEAIAVILLAVTGGGKIEYLEGQVVEGDFIRRGSRLVTEGEVALLQRQLTDGDAWNATALLRRLRRLGRGLVTGLYTFDDIIKAERLIRQPGDMDAWLHQRDHIKVPAPAKQRRQLEIHI